MTEHEYVETIRKAAEGYCSAMPCDDDTAANYRTFLAAQAEWDRAKLYLSPQTAIALCDAWLTMQEAAESPAVKKALLDLNTRLAERNSK